MGWVTRGGAHLSSAVFLDGMGDKESSPGIGEHNPSEEIGD